MKLGAIAVPIAGAYGFDQVSEAISKLANVGAYVFISQVLSGLPLDVPLLPSYTHNMSTQKRDRVGVPCLCYVLRQASRAVSRLYDGQALSAVSATRRRSSRLVPPAAWTAMPWITVVT